MFQETEASKPPNCKMTQIQNVPDTNDPNLKTSQLQNLPVQKVPFLNEFFKNKFICVSHPGKGGCADPVNEDAILERVGSRPPGRNRERQLASDTGDGKT